MVSIDNNINDKSVYHCVKRVTDLHTPSVLQRGGLNMGTGIREIREEDKIPEE